jgi:hypothetical protein
VINSAGNVYDIVYNVHDIVYNNNSSSWSEVGGTVGNDAMLIAPISSSRVLVVDTSGDIHDYKYSEGSWVPSLT